MTRYLFVFMLMLINCACDQQVNGRQDELESEPKGARGEPEPFQVFADLEEALAYHGKSEGGNEWDLAFDHHNSHGYVGLLNRSAQFCGTGGCTLFIFARSSGEVTLVGKIPGVFKPIGFDEDRHLVCVHLRGVRQGYVDALDYVDGKFRKPPYGGDLNDPRCRGMLRELGAWPAR